MKLVQVVTLIQFAVVCGLVVSTDSWASTRPFKEVAFLASTGVLVLLASWRATRLGKHEFSVWPFDVPLVLFTMWALFSSILASHHWAVVEPAMMLVALISLHLMVRGSRMLLTHLQRMWLALCLISGFIAAIGILQYFGAGPRSLVIFRTTSSAGSRVYSTMGNPNFLASFLNLGLFASVGLLLSGLPRRWILLTTLSIVLLLTALLMAQSKGSVIGTGAGGAVLCYLHRRLKPGSRKSWLALRLAALTVLVVLGMTIISLRVSPGRHSGLVRDPVRRFIWRGSLRMILARPIVGHGLGQWSIVFPVFHHGESPEPDPRYIAKHAHCELLELAGELGLIGLGFALCGLALFIGAFERADRPTHQEARSRSALATGGLAGVVAVLAQSAVSVNTRWIQVAYPTLLFAALSFGAIAPYCKSMWILRFRISRRLSVLLRMLCSVVLGFAFALFALVGYRIVVAAVHNNEARVLAMTLGSARTPALQRELARKAIKRLRVAVSLNPYLVDGWYLLGSSYLFIDRYGDAIRAFNSVYRLSPEYGRIHLLSAEAHLGLGEPDAAKAELERDLSIHRSSVENWRLLFKVSQQANPDA